MVGLLEGENVLEEVNAQGDDVESTEQRGRVGSASRVEASEEDEGGEDGRRGEAHVVDGVHDVRGEEIEGLQRSAQTREIGTYLVKVIHLHDDAAYHHKRKDPGPRAPKLVVARERQFERESEPLDGHD